MMDFNSHLQESTDILQVVGDLESEWAMFQAAILKAAVQSCGYKLVLVTVAISEPVGDIIGERFPQAEGVALQSTVSYWET